MKKFILASLFALVLSLGVGYAQRGNQFNYASVDATANGSTQCSYTSSSDPTAYLVCDVGLVTSYGNTGADAYGSCDTGSNSCSSSSWEYLGPGCANNWYLFSYASIVSDGGQGTFSETLVATDTSVTNYEYYWDQQFCDNQNVQSESGTVGTVPYYC